MIRNNKIKYKNRVESVAYMSWVKDYKGKLTIRMITANKSFYAFGNLILRWLYI